MPSESITVANSDTTEVITVPSASPDLSALEPEITDASTITSKDSAQLLFISDEPVASECLLAAQAAGFAHDVCAFSQALSLLTSGSYHAAVVNVRIPEEAFSLIGQVRASASCRQVPIVALVDPADVNPAFRAGASFAAPRPVTPELLKNTLGAIYRIAVGLRRLYARYRVQISLTLTVGERSINAKATDIGNGGMALVAAEPLASGTVVSVCFVLPGSDEQIVAVGEIRWGDGHGRAGFCFINIAGTGRESLENWLACRLAGIDQPLPSRAPAAPVILASTSDEAVDPARRNSSIVLSAVLVAFCLFVVGFWVYVALSS